MGFFGRKNKEKQYCFVCKKELGMMKFYVDTEKEESPKGMSKEDRVCFDCFKKLPKKEKLVKEDTTLKTKELEGSKLDRYIIDFADLYLEQKYDKCIELGESFYEKYPNNIHVIKNLSDVYFTTAQYEKCKSITEKGLKIFPGNSFLLYLLADSYLQLSDTPEKALKILQDGLKIVHWDSHCTEKMYRKFLTKLTCLIDGNYENDEIKQIDEEISSRNDFIGKLMNQQSEFQSLLEDAILSETGQEYEFEELINESQMHIEIYKAEIKELENKREKIIEEKRKGKQENQVQKSTDDDPLKILKLRLAKGEITKDEYSELKSTLNEMK